MLQAVPGLHIKVGLAYVQNRLDRYEVLLQKFFASSVNDLTRLSEAVASDDRAGIAAAAHSLRGAAAVVGATTVEAAAQAVETAIRQRCSGDELKRVIRALEESRAALASAVGAVATPTPAAQ